MNTRVLTAAPLVEQIKTNLVERCLRLKEAGIIPSMSVVLVGNNPASLTYIRNKKKMCEEIGAQFDLLQLDENISENDFLSKLNELNNDPKVHGIIIQLPVSDHLKKLNLPNLVSPEKDIDGFHGLNTQKIYAGSTNLDTLMPCTPKGIINLLNYYQLPVAGKNILVIGRSLIVGKPLSMLLSNLNATVTLAHSQTKNLEFFTKNADIIVVAIGKANFVTEKHIDPKKQTIVIDVGMNTLNGKLTGDVEQEKVAPLVTGISPVPGGVGPMTVISLIDNLIIAAESKLKGIS
jgi:methylenetetrahydrofolate dehydrogenase (NADP+)/methenyltetrahydrofolate cyclohydrolase